MTLAQWRKRYPQPALNARQSGRLGGLTLGVFDSGASSDRRVVDQPRVIATAHLGGFTQECIDRAMSAAVDNLIRELTRRHS